MLVEVERGQKSYFDNKHLKYFRQTVRFQLFKVHTTNASEKNQTQG